MQRLTKSFYGWFGLVLAVGIFHSTSAQTSSQPPTITIISPTNGEVFFAPANIQIIAKASNSVGVVSNVEFFVVTNELPGNVGQVVLDPPGVHGVTGLVYLLAWSNVPPGSYSLTAVASEGPGISVTSAPVNIIVLPIGPLPVVRITSPPNHAIFYAPLDIPLFAYANIVYADATSNLSTTISNVEFFAGTNDLGPAQQVIEEPSGPGVPPIFIVPNEYTLVWSNPPPGAWALIAVATDTVGVSATSAPVNIIILPSGTNTNAQDIVSIVATDPVAIAGTNCWVWPGLASAAPTWADWRQPTWTNFTNCGPKDAAFTVRREGEDTNDLTVLYAIGGTASNRVDYTYLPGFVTIPAGEHCAIIPIVPLATLPLAAIETVVLTLEASSNQPPVYLPGFPRSAAAIIVDSWAPRPITGLLPGGFFHLNATGPDGAWFCIQSSTELSGWQPVATNQVVNGSIDFVDPGGVAGPRQFYQAVPLISIPAQ